MQKQRLTRINELLRREIATVLYREVTDTGINLAAVTITRAAITPNLRRAHIGVSVLGGEAEWNRVLRALNRHRPAIQQAVNRHVILKYTPVLVFERDATIAEGDRVLRLIEEFAPDENANPPSEPNPPGPDPEVSDPDDPPAEN